MARQGLEKGEKLLLLFEETYDVIKTDEVQKFLVSEGQTAMLWAVYMQWGRA